MLRSHGLGPLSLRHLAAACAVAALAVVALTVPSDRRLGMPDAGVVSPSLVRAALWSGPIVEPVRRRAPATPPWPPALVAAGDIVPPVLAPDSAPLPERKNAALAAAHRRAAASARATATIVARRLQSGTAAD